MTEGKHYQVWRTWLERGHLHHEMDPAYSFPTQPHAVDVATSLALKSVATIMVEVVEEPGSRVVWITKGRR